MPTPETVEIYEILDPRDGSVRYIGKANNAAKRFKEHMREARRRTPLYHWIAKMRGMGLVPTYRIASVCSVDDWKECEKQAIAKAREEGVNLLNIADGGDEPYCSPEVRAANGRMTKGRKRTGDPLKLHIWRIKQELSALLNRGYVTDATKAKLRRAAAMRPDLFGEWASL